jgi:Uma2 family endonuclease
MATTHQIWTAERLLHTPDLGRCELVRGELIMMTPAGFEHGCIAMEIGAMIRNFVTQHALGVVTGAETGFHIAHDPDTVRAPDAGFIRAERVPAARMRGFFRGPPDLAVEVVSPEDRAKEVVGKVHCWLDAGCRAVWVVDPDTRTVTVYRSRSEPRVLRAGEQIVDADLLPGFALPVAAIFPA